MVVEVAENVGELDETQPPGTDEVRQGDDHIRLIKTAIKNTFPALAGPVLATETELNLLAGLTELPAAGGGDESSSGYCPGYTFVYSDADTFTIAGLDVTNMFNQGRRVKFTLGDVSIYGVVDSSAYVTDTTINLTMESAAVLADVAYTICLVTGTLGWSPVAESSMAGLGVLSVATGTVGVEEYIVAVGVSGSVVYSTDGTTWTAVVTSPFPENLVKVLYDPANELFIVGNTLGELAYSDDGGATWATVSSTGQSGQIDSNAFSIKGDRLYKPIAGAIGWIPLNNLAAGTWTYHTAADGMTAANARKFHSNDYHMSAYSSGDDLVFRYVSTDGGTDAVFDTNITFEAGNSIAQVVEATALGTLCIGTNGYLFQAVTPSSPAGTYTLRDAGFTTSTIINGVYSEFLGIYVIVGADGKIAYSADLGVTWVQVSNGFNLEAVQAVTYNETLRIFIAGGANGTICLSTSGIN